MHIDGFVKAILPYVKKVELGPVKIEDDDKCCRTLRIVTSNCVLELVLTGQAPEALKALNLRK
jgi:hypothetical protein